MLVGNGFEGKAAGAQPNGYSTDPFTLLAGLP